ncbi:hypothetical protein DFH06DRAFT_1195333 [Mycena polygramma]|nr:hypothetical protein DFH06DRAFT_1195333 [Mycena polygramma]
MPVQEGPTASQSLSDNDRLIDALKSCFSDLIKQQEDLQKTVESLKPPTAGTDKNTKFWNAYMKVADEHDKEFKEKYSTDLDVALIFAGLFSAVSSAFIIQIQPQLTPDAPTLIVAVQGLLYTSLFTTLLAALLAVLGKQWVMHYQAAGSRGTIEERGLERQRKLDGLNKWKLDMVLQMFPLLLQLALLLFWGGLSVYLWPIHRSIAGLVIGLTLLGSSSYILLLGSAIVFPDSPFQTPLTPFLIPVFRPAFQILQATITKLRIVTTHVWSLLASFRMSRTWILPSSLQQTSGHVAQSVSAQYSHRYFTPSAEAPAIVWLLETSTDPVTVEAAAEMAGDLQWPLDLDFTAVIGRLTDLFISCFHAESWRPHVRNGLEHRAIHCGLALSCLRHLTQESGHDTGDSIFLPWSNLSFGMESQKNLSSAQERQLLIVCWNLHMVRLLPARSTRSIRNLGQFLDRLRAETMPSLDEHSFATYLCCINSFFDPTEPRIVGKMEKSGLQVSLLSQLFKALQATAADNSLVARVINTTVHLADISFNRQGDPFRLEELMTEICKFCSTFPLDQQPLPMVALANLATVDNPHNPMVLPKGLQLTEWVFPALEHVQSQWENDPHARDPNKTAVQGLLQFLAFTSSECLPHEPPLPSVHLILRALSVPGNTSLMAYLTLCHAPHWFCNSSLQPVLQDSLVWRKLGQLSISYHTVFAKEYFSLGEKLVNAPEWQAVIHSDLPAWVMVFVQANGVQFDREEAQFISVIRSVWVPELTDKETVLNEENKSWILAIEALGNVWEALEPLPAPHEYLRLARCTAATSLRTNFFHFDFRDDSYTQLPISRDIRSIFSAKLGKSLVQSATKARDAVNMALSTGTEIPSTPLIHRIAELLDVLGKKLSTELGPTSGEVVLDGVTEPYKDWGELQMHFDDVLDTLEGLLGVERVE